MLAEALEQNATLPPAARQLQAECGTGRMRRRDGVFAATEAERSRARRSAEGDPNGRAEPSGKGSRGAELDDTPHAVLPWQTTLWCINARRVQ
jgi:hypothetical protein